MNQIQQGILPVFCQMPIRKHQRSTFSVEEDEKLRKLVDKHGTNWGKICKSMPHRNKRQCKERWEFYLSPTINKSPWSHEEDELLINLTDIYGTKWALICKKFENRTPVNVKNRFMVLKRKHMIPNYEGENELNYEAGNDHICEYQKEAIVKESIFDEDMRLFDPFDELNFENILTDDEIIEFIDL